MNDGTRPGINAVTFAAEMTLLRDRFSRKDMTEEVTARYHDFLNQHLTTEEFVTAARAIFNDDTFWPSPMRFLEVIHRDPKGKAQLAWRLMLEHAKAGHFPPLNDLDEATRAALKAAPMREIMSADEFTLKRLQRDFVDAHMTSQGDDDDLRLPSDPLRLS